MRQRTMFFGEPSANLLADRMRFLANPELLADAFEFCQPEGFDAQAWAEQALILEGDLKEGRPIQLNDRNVALLVESLEGNRVIGQAGKRRPQMIELAKIVAHRLEPHAGRRVMPEVD
ncbi:MULTISPECIES: hypothetical protein [Pseudomonas]|uniref:hypothetical protein n=1 Tax=Pseudomonas TaxID=286 RepID=UPI000A9D9403|nr:MULTISPECIES: hypothetical protein [Pseudomonas]MDG9809504.1 hypothetical protein [Pseudomonas juntendi]MDG9815750.1 hypothetical protein [Pseudomonas putida]